jgi:hypothetical protein
MLLPLGYSRQPRPSRAAYDRGENPWETTTSDLPALTEWCVENHDPCLRDFLNSCQLGILVVFRLNWVAVVAAYSLHLLVLFRRSQQALIVQKHYGISHLR